MGHPSHLLDYLTLLLLRLAFDERLPEIQPSSHLPIGRYQSIYPFHRCLSHQFFNHSPFKFINYIAHGSISIQAHTWLIFFLQSAYHIIWSSAHCEAFLSMPSFRSVHLWGCVYVACRAISKLHLSVLLFSQLIGHIPWGLRYKAFASRRHFRGIRSIGPRGNFSK